MEDSDTTIAAPKLFVSYSWTTPDHEQWIIDLATELRALGIDVLLDKWDLFNGDDDLPPSFGQVSKLVNSGICG